MRGCIPRQTGVERTCSAYPRLEGTADEEPGYEVMRPRSHYDDKVDSAREREVVPRRRTGYALGQQVMRPRRHHDDKVDSGRERGVVSRRREKEQQMRNQQGHPRMLCLYIYIYIYAGLYPQIRRRRRRRRSIPRQTGVERTCSAYPR